ncbi:helix-turn-helix domain-containing protein [Enterococcus lemanii]|uniref:Helix-turn-helix domain-containing protein n=1 Tax=Enterococcus lemanii TaxID=1159752 RepID=A0ABV9MW76_9ENTE|nr:helix-turn-helix transcriptional regulator [Enterococcus lemanii]MBM7709505.1 transcriptional regulator with XRE-family HTH domain [Enterococcus lemanii]
MNHNKIIIDRLYYFLRQKNMTINKLADLTGIRQSTLSNMINRESVPKLDMLYKLCEALEVSLVDFLNIPPYNEKKKAAQDQDFLKTLSENQIDKLKDFIEAIKLE